MSIPHLLLGYSFLKLYLISCRVKLAWPVQVAKPPAFHAIIALMRPMRYWYISFPPLEFSHSHRTWISFLLHNIRLLYLPTLYLARTLWHQLELPHSLICNRPTEKIHAFSTRQLTSSGNVDPKRFLAKCQKLQSSGIKVVERVH